jgi:hypothetical protein
MSSQLRRVCRAIVLVAVTAIGIAQPAAAQNVGTVVGTVKDPQGLTVPGATVTLTSRVSQTKQEAVADDVGRFSFGNVPFGTYLLSASLAGFSQVDQVIDVRSTVTLTRDVQLGVATVSETVNVSADSLLEASSVGSHVSLGASLIDQLPSATPSKQLSSVLLSAPGFIPSQNGRIHVRGSHGQIQYVLDGVSLTDEFSEAFANPLDPQYVKSAAVMTGGIPAEYGNKLAAVVDITSRSGLDMPKRVFGTAAFNAGRFGALDGGLTVGGRLSSKVGYFLSGGASRTDRYLDPPTIDNFHNSGHGSRFTGKLEFRPSDADFVRVVASASASTFDVPNRPVSQALGVNGRQQLSDDSQTVTWLRQIGPSATLDLIGYRRAARAELGLSSGVPLAATQDRTLDHQGGSAALSYSSGAHRFKAGFQAERNPVSEVFSVRATSTDIDAAALLFDPRQGGRPFDFIGRQVGSNIGAYVQDLVSPTAELHISAGIRIDRYSLLVTESAISPRLGVSYHIHRTETVLRGSYSRLFMPPFAENLLVSSSPETRALSPNSDIGGGTDVRSERQHAFEIGVQQALGRHARLDVSFYRKNIRNVADVDQFTDTTVTFPIAVDRGRAQGIEARLDIPVVHGVNGYVSLSRASMINIAPLSGGLMLGAPLKPGEEFFADHDQRWQSQFGVGYEHPSRRVFASFTGRFDSGIPFFLPADFDPATFEDQLALSLVDLDSGRAKSRVLANVLVGTQLYRRGSTNLELQAGVVNAFDTTHVLNFLSIFNGTHYGPPRTWTTRLKVSF